MRCHFVTVDGERLFIPCCMSSLYQEDACYCTCIPPPEKRMASTEARQELLAAQKEIYRLERLLYRLTKHNAFKPKPKNQKPCE